MSRYISLIFFPFLWSGQKDKALLKEMECAIIIANMVTLKEIVIINKMVLKEIVEEVDPNLFNM